jgi:hypothetical protein
MNTERAERYETCAGNKPTPSELELIKTIAKEHPGLRVRFTHQRSVGQVVAVAFDGERAVRRADAETRSAALDALQESLKRNPPAATSTSATRPAGHTNQKLTREEMLRRIRLAEAGL